MTRVLHSTELELKSCLDANKSTGDLDGIINAHDNYFQVIRDRCFLNPKESAVLRNTVIKVLDICLTLHGFCDRFCSEFCKESTAGDDDVMSLEEKRRKCSLLKSLKCASILTDHQLDKMEQNYWKCHQFLATTLKSITLSRNVPHLEGLTAAFSQTLPKSHA